MCCRYNPSLPLNVVYMSWKGVLGDVKCSPVSLADSVLCQIGTKLPAGTQSFKKGTVVTGRVAFPLFKFRAMYD